MRFSTFIQQNARWLGAGALLTFLSSFGQTFFISLFAGQIRTEFGLSHGEWGGIYSLGTLASAILMVWAGALTDRFRVRSLGTIVLLSLAVACVLMAVNTAVWFLPVVIFALRFTGQGMTSHIAVVAMARWFVATRGKALAIATLGFSFGEAFLPITFVGLMVFVDWRILWVVAALISLAALPILALLLRHEREPASLSDTPDSAGMSGRHWTRSQCLGHWLFWAMAPAILGPSAFNTAFFFHQVHFAEIKGWAHIDLVALFPFYTTVSVGAMVLSGWALDRWGTGKLLPWFQVPMVFAFILFSQSNSYSGAVLGLFFLALTTGANATLPAAFWAEYYGTRHVGAIKAAAAAVMVLGSAIGPGVTGGLIDAGMALTNQFLWIAAYFLGTSILLGFAMKRARGLLKKP